MLSLGLDIGYSSIKLALIDRENRILYHAYKLHRGNIRETLDAAIKDLLRHPEAGKIRRGAVTGSGGRGLSKKCDITFVNEATAVVEGAIALNNTCKSIIEIGGQSAKYITGFSTGDPSGIRVSMNANCSAGTGSFLEEQVSRLKLKLEDYASHAEKAATIPRIAGRCSVFAKTDITHHQQEGVPVEDILRGLAHAMVRNYRGSVMRKLPLTKPILFVGGVAHNGAIVNTFKELLDLKEDEFIRPLHFAVMGALGAAVMANMEDCPLNTDLLLKALEQRDGLFREPPPKVLLPNLLPFGDDDASGKHDFSPVGSGPDRRQCWLGIDVGSTSTNLVLTDENNRMVSFQYLRTLGNPLAAVQRGLTAIQEEFGNGIMIAGVGTTGSGRLMIGKMVGADVIKDEITCQARAAVHIDPAVDTIFEIGGQDSKYIGLKDGVVTDFQMNKICAAGTGSFIEEQAVKFGLPIQDLGKMALKGTHPISLGERCTVFMETSIAAHLARGAHMEEIASGLCYSIVKNYLNRVVGQKRIGEKIFLQGGIAYHQGVVNAFRALTKKTIVVPPFFSVTGAYGVAMLAREEMGCGKTRFKGFDMEVKAPPHDEDKGGRENRESAQVFDKAISDLIFAGYKDVPEPEKKTVGIPRALFTFGMFPMFNAFFRELGFNVLLSDPTHEKTIQWAQEYALDETCYPVKLINGHVAELVRKKVDYIFFPDLFTVEHPGSYTRQNYGCAYMQLAFKIVNQAMELGTKGITLLAPTIAFGFGREFMMKSFMGLGGQLGKTPEQTGMALQKGMQSFHAYEKRVGETGREVIDGIGAEEKVFVLISKIYGIADGVLNMNIPGKLMEMGYRVLPFYYLPEGDISPRHPNMYWPFGQHILNSALFIKEHPNLYGILLTHHGCGPDSVLSHFFREIMGAKPYLNIEVDEHSSHVGVITRVEAFVNSLCKTRVKKAHGITSYLRNIVQEKVNIETSPAGLEDKAVLLLPNLYPYSFIFGKMLANKGIAAGVLPFTDGASIDEGRKYALTNEYFSLTSLLGDVLTALKGRHGDTTVFVPQTEGAEVHGQYHRYLRTKLDENGYEKVKIIAPFLEDALFVDPDQMRSIRLGLLAGDVIRTAPPKSRDGYLQQLLELLDNEELEIGHLERMARKIRGELQSMANPKKILAAGEPFLLYNDHLNNDSFRDLENNGYRVVYSPLSECMWLTWHDHVAQNQGNGALEARERLEKFREEIESVSRCLGDESPFEEDLDTLIDLADKHVGFYAGAQGRYREAKMLCDLPNILGIINAMAMYENTGIALGILHRGFESKKPVLNLTFDGNKNENDQTKIDAFLCYL